jgi:maltose alpha-D-glucosyltransferase/alpha-amylase
MLGNNRARLELAHSLMLTLPGTPVLRYGDEIGMGEDLSLPERESIRTPMQWADAENGGFSTAAAERLVLPAVKGGEFGYERINVAAQQHDPNSFLNWLERMIRLRTRSPEFGAEQFDWLEASDPAVLAHCCSTNRSRVWAVHNLSGREVHATVTLGRKVDRLFNLLENCEHRGAEDGVQKFRLQPYGYLWLRETDGAENGAGGDCGAR